MAEGKTLATWRLLLAVVIGGWMAVPAAWADGMGHVEPAASTGGPQVDPEEPPNTDCDTDCECPADSSEDPASNSEDGDGDTDPAHQKVGDPVDVFTGRYFSTDTDLVVNGVYPIRILRRYQSQSRYDSPLGYGWALNYDLQLYESTDPAGNELVILRSLCGDRDRWVWNGTSFDAASPEKGRLGDLEVDGSGYRLRYTSGRQAFFADDGRLERIEDVGGNSLVFEYREDAGGNTEKVPLTGTSPYSIRPDRPLVVAQPYQLTKISESLASGGLSGRFVELHYHPDGHPRAGRLDYIRSSDGREVHYTHEEVLSDPDDPLSPLSTSGNLVQVDGLEGIVQTYAYSNPADPDNDPNDHNLRIVQDGQGTANAVIEYDTKDRVKKETVGQSVWDLDYFDGTSPPRREVTRTVVTPTSTTPAVTTYDFNDQGFPLEITDAEGNRRIFKRESTRPYLHAVITCGPTDSCNVASKCNDDASPCVLADTCPPGDDGCIERSEVARVVELEYDIAGNLSQRIDYPKVGTNEKTVTETWTYDHRFVSSHEITSTASPEVFRTEFTFYPNAYMEPARVHEIKRQTAPGPPATYETTTLEYDANGQLERVIPPSVDGDALQIVRSYHPTGADQGLLQTIQLEVQGAADPHLRRDFEYDARGLVSRVTDARGKQTDFVWDDRGRILRVTNVELGETTEFIYSGPNGGLPDPATAPPGRFLARIDRGQTAAGAGDGQAFRLRWDARGRLVETERRDGLTPGAPFVSFQTFSYDSDGNRLAASDGLRTTSFAYDLLSRLTTVTDAAQNVTSFGYDAFGNRTRITDALGRVTQFAFDPLDRLESVTRSDPTASPPPAPLVTAFTYDAAGNVTRVTDPKGQRTDYAYDTLSRPRSVTQELGIDTPDPDDFSVRYAYDARGRLDTVTNARDQVLDYGYFAWGGLEQVVHVGTSGPRTVSYSYDLNGNLRSTADSDLATGVAATADLPADRLYTFTYDALDRVDTATAHYLPGGNVVLDSDYDRFGNRDALTVTQGADVLAHGWLYDALDRLTQATLPAAAQPLAFTYLANDDLETLTHGNGLLTTVSYLAEGPIDTLTLANGGTTVQLLDYTVDELLQITGVDETSPGATPSSASTTYGYDFAQRLTTADFDPATGLTDESYVYDPAGNREDPVSPADYDYDGNNRITASPGATGYSHDDDGNRTAGPSGETYTWDSTNRLRMFSKTGTTASYLYDPFGRRIRKTVDSDGGGPLSPETTWYLWDGDDLWGEYDGSGVRQRRYAYAGGFAPVEVADGATGAETVYEVHTDHLDTPRLLTDAAGTVVWQARHQAFGEVAVDEDPDGDLTTVSFQMRFPGQYFDQETGLHYNRFRYYDPGVGRYVSADPIGQAGGVNVYGYALNIPTRFIDPDGRDAWEKIEVFFTAGPVDALRGGVAAREQAEDIAARSGLPGAHNGPQDAYRHCVWQCETTKQANAQDAQDIGDAHERAGDRQGQPPSERAMDEHNNEEGRDCGLNDPRDCAVSCMDKLSKGNLAGPGGTPMPAPPMTPVAPSNPGPAPYY